MTSARGETRTLRRFRREDWDVEVRTRTVLTSTVRAFVVTAELDAYESDGDRGPRRVFADSWHREIPRDEV
ncbi:hypothetical protein FK530_13175 [Tsukamurella conjunctivitidis]|uniref:Uncharacterized protein n=1 Tax=Tsukamurella conjunctivitidis TaxID=2592068 RepID=A0A5C5S1K7_9ACTN|nr:hypothetical protein [Tsukamurella conjunctivitidis]TWS28558.1 hypothetical protein FK530_13175 [Tsukamurella conjunctivitidis]